MLRDKSFEGIVFKITSHVQSKNNLKKHNVSKY